MNPVRDYYISIGESRKKNIMSQEQKISNGVKLYLIENYTPELKFDNNSLIIGLTPLACYQLGKAGVDYRIWEDYVDVSEFINQYPEYCHEKKIWFREFDKFLIEIFPQVNLIKLPPATAYSFYLKSIIDSLVLRAREFQTLFNKVNPDRVVYASQLPESGIADLRFLFWRNTESLFSQLAPLICKKRNIPLEKIQIPLRVKNEKEKKLFINKRLNIRDIKKFIANKKFFKVLWNDIKTIDLRARNHKIGYLKSHSKAGILFLEQNSYLRKIMVEAIKAGYKVYYKSGNSIIRQYCGFHLTKCGIDSKKGETELALDLEKVLQKLKKNTNLIDWLNQACELNVESVISPKLLNFIEVTSPEVIFWTNEYTKIYDNLKIRFIFLSNCSTPADQAAVAACHYLQKTKTVYIPHGDDVFDNWEFIDDFISSYDMSFVSNDEFARYLKERKFKGEFNTDIFQLPIRYSVLPTKRPLRQKMKNGKQKIVFMPTMYQWDNILLWTALWPDTWYFHWHKKLLEFFASRTDFEFIWKALPASNETYDPILDIIKEKKYRNVRYETSSFSSWISKADRILLDCPSTALYEAAFSGLPVMSLYFAPFCRVRKGAIKMFKKSLQPFSNFNEGIQKISAFLDTDASQFIANIPHSKQPFINLLNNILGNNIWI